jgi:hypothetical protein
MHRRAEKGIAMARKYMLASMALLLAAAIAQPVRADEADEDGPGRGVARISVINGDVSVKRGDSGDLVAAALNAPLVVEDRVFTGSGSRAEVQFDWASMIRLSSNAEIRFAELEYRRYIIQVARGTVTFRVLRDLDADIEISTPSVAVRPVKRGVYRVSVHDDGTSEITTRSGEAEIFTTRGSERLRAGKTMLARGTTADPEFRVVAEVDRDEWDRWNELRDRDLERSRSYEYLSHDIYGAEDLDDHGRWVSVPSYGYVWTPRVAVGWAPYRYGRWSWIDWYGWSWVSHDPWGWAPYHYGRWFYSAPYGWCWYPGQRYRRHYWSPALVGFVGFGRGFGVGVGFGHVGWVPLGPHDRFNRWWGSRYYGGYRNRNYIDNSVNIVNNVNITNVYRNARIQNSVTAVDYDGFGRGRGGRGIRINEGEFTRASVVQGQLPVAPHRESLRLADRNVNGVNESRADRFYSRRTAAQVERVPFEDQRRGVETAARRTFGSTSFAEETGRGSRTAAVDTPAARTPGDEGRGWRRVDQPDGSPSSTGRSGVERSERQGSEWRRFGSPRTAESTGARSGRFGEPATGRSPDSTPDTGRAVAPRSDNNNWRRFENRSETSTAEPGFSERRSERTNDGWRRGDSPRTESPRFDSSRSESPRFDSSRSESRRSESAPRYESAPRDQPPRSSPSRGADSPVRISPPIVRDRGGERGGRGDVSEGARSAPRMDTGGMRGGGGGGGDRGAARGGGGAAPSRGNDGGGGGGRGGDRGGGEGRGGRGGR